MSRNARRDRHDRHGARKPGRGEARAVDRVDRDVDRGAASRAEPLAEVQHGRVVLLTLADDHAPVGLDVREGRAHRRDRRTVDGVAVARADQRHRGDRREPGRLREGEGERMRVERGEGHASIVPDDARGIRLSPEAHSTRR
jgi:hypothetical protein